MGSIKTVAVLGANGNVGSSTIKALLEEGFQVTGLVRKSSTATVPEGAKRVEVDLSDASLLEAFKNQDAVVSTISSITPGGALSLQKSFIDAAIAANVQIFIPSEFGIDTADPSASRYVPFIEDKIEIADYLRRNQSKISWAAFITGSVFDWGLNIPGFGGWNIADRSVTVFDGGDIPYEATTLRQVGKAIAKGLKAPELIKNKYVYVNSFTVNQNQVLKAIESAVGEKFTVSKGAVEDLWQSGATQVKEGDPFGVLGMIAGAIYGKGNLANYSATKGLWNEKLGLPHEDLAEVLHKYLAQK
ncbi:NAD(P)-binding protein [Melanomma pulvis-pyrius CBS 109.77]|uniref:NAD(P)-binding protein n=1 Tax=Melanomma pulvis-pyrius CBS 109.77 TaxID=1314802 RepID=A0A6A6XI37_9PLEO|nr:NAD(P)-binding protein [Melanomma pulvis-pyrius CBS 109.77]